MSNWPLAGGAVKEPADDQNFRSLSEKGGEVEGKLTVVEESGVAPSGAAGGDLTGTYPNPTLKVARATQAAFENEIVNREAADKAEKEGREAGDTTVKGEVKTEKEARETAVASEKSSRETADGERVKGPGSATESDIAVYDGTTGKLVKDGGKTVAQVLARANHTGTQLAATVSDFDTQVRTSRLDQMTAPTVDLSINSHKLTKVNEPTEGTDAANKTYVDTAASAAAAGLSIKNPVSYATTTGITFSAGTEKTLEGTCPFEIDAKVAPAVATRLLLKNQAAQKRNGIHEVTKMECWEGDGVWEGEGEWEVGESWLLTRTSDADAEGEVKQGMYVSVLLGTTNGGTAWTQSTADPIVIGTTAQTFSPYTAVPGGAAGGDLTGTYPNPMIAAGAIVNADVNAAAAIAYSKLNLATSILNADIATAAEIVYSKLKLAASIKGTDLVEGTVEEKRLAKAMIVGAVKSGGETEAGEGFTSEKTGTGKYKITLSTELATVGIMVATPRNTESMRMATNPAKKVFEVEALSATAVPENGAFTFMIKPA